MLEASTVIRRKIPDWTPQVNNFLSKDLLTHQILQLGCFWMDKRWLSKTLFRKINFLIMLGGSGSKFSTKVSDSMVGKRKSWWEGLEAGFSNNLKKKQLNLKLKLTVEIEWNTNIMSSGFSQCLLPTRRTTMRWLWLFSALASYWRQQLSEALWAQMALWCGAVSSLPGPVGQWDHGRTRHFIYQLNLISLVVWSPSEFFILFFYYYFYIQEKELVCFLVYGPVVGWPGQQRNIHPVSCSLNLLFFLGKQNRKRVTEIDMLKSPFVY